MVHVKWPWINYWHCYDIWDLLSTMIKSPVQCSESHSLGIVLDSISMSLELPEQKLTELKDLLVTANQAKKLTKRQLQSLAGKLNWASQCIQGGRTFMRRILNAIPHLRAPWHRIRVNKDMRDDLVWWLTYLQPHNGTTPMCDNRPVSPIWLTHVQSLQVVSTMVDTCTRLSTHGIKQPTFT